MSVMMPMAGSAYVIQEHGGNLLRPKVKRDARLRPVDDEIVLQPKISHENNSGSFNSNIQFSEFDSKSI